MTKRRPLRRIGGIDVVVLPDAVQGEGNRKDEEDRDDVELEGDPPAAGERDDAEDAEVERDRGETLAGDAALQLRLVRHCLLLRGAEVDREERGSEVEELQPARVALRGEPVPLRIV